MEIFLYTCAILQRFRLSLPPGVTYRSKGVTDFLGRIPADSPIRLVFTRRQ